MHYLLEPKTSVQLTYWRIRDTEEKIRRINFCTTKITYQENDK